MYENPWYFNNKPFESEDIEKFQGFVYLIINLVYLIINAEE